MKITEAIRQQRIKHIVSSYRLAGEDLAQFEEYLNGLLALYPSAWIELALVETLASVWVTVPMPRGSEFLARAHQLIQQWETLNLASTITPDQFQQITGLDPRPIFATSEFAS